MVRKVVCINPTGSTGYGSQFTRDIRNHWGSWPYKGAFIYCDFNLAVKTYIINGRLDGWS